MNNFFKIFVFSLLITTMQHGMLLNPDLEKIYHLSSTDLQRNADLIPVSNRLYGDGHLQAWENATIQIQKITRNHETEFTLAINETEYQRNETEEQPNYLKCIVKFANNKSIINKKVHCITRKIDKNGNIIGRTGITPEDIQKHLSIKLLQFYGQTIGYNSDVMFANVNLISLQESIIHRDFFHEN